MNTHMIAERAVVLQLLRADHDERWSRLELERELSDVSPLLVNSALATLVSTGVAVPEGECARASAATRCIDSLGLIAV